MEESQQMKSREIELLRRKNQELDRENLHLKKSLLLLEERYKKGFDEEKEIIERLAKIPKEQTLSKLRELMKEINYWQERFSQSEARLEEYRLFPQKIEEYELKINEITFEKQNLKKNLEETKEKLAFITQQKARLEGEITGKGAQISKLNELESEKKTLKMEFEDMKSKYDKMNLLFSDKSTIESKYNETKHLLLDRETRLKTLANEINRLNELILEQKSETDKLKGRTFRLDEIQIMYQKEREFRENEIKALKNRLGDDGSPRKKLKNFKREYELQIEALKNELSRTIEDRKLKVIENENLKKDIGDLNVELRLKEDLKDDILDKENRIKATLEEVNRLNDVLGSVVSSHEKSTNKLNEYENKIIMLTSEIQRLNQLLRGKNEENDMMKLRFGEMDTRFLGQKEKYEEKIKQLSIDMEKIKGKLRANEATKALEINHLRIKIDDFKKIESAGLNDNKEENAKENPSKKQQEKEPLEDVKRRMKREMMMLDERNRTLKEDNDHIRRQADNWRDELERIEQENLLLKSRVTKNQPLTENQQQSILMQSEHMHKIASDSNETILRLNAENLDLKEKLRLLQMEGLDVKEKLRLLQMEGFPNEELGQSRLENNDLKARISYLSENLELLQRKYNDLERLYQNQKNIANQHYSEIDSLQRVHSEHQLQQSNLTRDKESFERAYEELKYRYATLELEAKRNIQRIEHEFQAKSERIENESLMKYNLLNNEWTSRFENAENRWRIDYDKILIEMKAKEKIDETFEARSREYEEKVAFFAAECEKLKQILTDKEEEIMDLKEKFKEVAILEKEDLKENIGKLKQMLEVKLNELDALTIHCSQLQRFLDEKQGENNEIQRLKELLQLKINELDSYKENNENSLRIAEKNTILENELSRLARVLEGKVEENEDFHDKYQRLEGILSEKGGLEARCLDSEEKVMKLHSEMDRLIRDSRMKSQENEGLLRKLRNMEIAMNDSINLQNEIIRLKNILEEKLEEIDDWKAKNARFEAILGDKGSLEARIPEYERKIEVLSKDMEKLGFVYREKARENEELKVFLARQESQISDRGLLENEIRRLKEILEGKLQELDNNKARNSALELALADKDGTESRYREYQEKIRLLSNELEKVSVILGEKNEEIEAWRVKWSKIEGNLRDREVLENEVRKMRGILEKKLYEIEEIKALCTKYEMRFTECQQLEGRLKESEGKIQFLHQEIEKMSGLLQQKHEETEHFRLKCNRFETNLRDEEVLSTEFTKIKEILERKLEEIDQWKAKCSQYEVLLSEADNNEPRLKEAEKKHELLTNEIQKLSNALREKMAEIEEFRVKYSRIESNLRDRDTLEQEIARLKDILSGKLRELDDWKSRYVKLELFLQENAGFQGRFTDYEMKIQALSKELERTGGFLQEKIVELDEARIRISRLETMCRDSEILEKELRNMKEILGGKLVENDDLRGNNTRLEYLLAEKGGFEEKLREYEDKISLLAGELEKMSRVLREKTEENDELRNFIAKNENGNRDKDYANNEILRLKEILNGKLQETDDLRQKLSQISPLKQEIKGLENVRNSMNLEINRLSAIINEKNQVIETMRLRLLGFEGDSTEISILLRDMEKMREILQEKNREIEGFKGLLASFEQKKQAEIENMVKVLESKRIAHVETNVRANISQIDEIKEKLKESMLESEQLKEKCRKMDEIYRMESEKFRKREIELEEIQKKFQIFERNFEEIRLEKERKIEILAREIEKLTEVLNEKIRENDEIVKKNEFLSLNLEKLSPEFHYKLEENEGLKLRNEVLFKENEVFRVKIQKNLQEQERLRVELENSVVSDENYHDIDTKLKDLQRNLAIKSKELEDWKIKYLQLENELLKRPIIGEISQKPVILSKLHEKDEENREIKRLEELLCERNEELERFIKADELLHQENEGLLRENENLRRDLMNPRMEFHEIQQNYDQNAKFDEIRDENMKIKRLLGDKIHEIDEYKEKLEENQEKLHEFKGKLDENSKEMLLKETEIEKLKNGIKEISFLYKKDLGALEKKIKEKHEENTIFELKKELEEKEKEIRGFKEKNQALNNEFFGKECENSKLREKVMNLEHENFLSSLKKRDSVEEIGFSEVFFLFISY